MYFRNHGNLFQTILDHVKFIHQVDSNYVLYQVLWSFMHAKKDKSGEPEVWKFSKVRVLVVDEGSLVSVQILHSLLSMLTKHAQLQKFILLGKSVFYIYIYNFTKSKVPINVFVIFRGCEAVTQHWSWQHTVWSVRRSQDGPLGHWDADKPSRWVWAHRQKCWTVSRSQFILNIERVSYVIADCCVWVCNF